jgi:hypothetical protein
MTKTNQKCPHFADGRTAQEKPQRIPTPWIHVTAGLSARRTSNKNIKCSPPAVSPSRSVHRANFSFADRCLTGENQSKLWA